MTESGVEHLSFADLMAQVGSILFYWSGLEQQLTLSIREHRTQLGVSEAPIRGGLAERLEIWFDLISRAYNAEQHLSCASAVREQALKLREKRNQIVHGLQGGHATPEEGEAYIRCLKRGYEEPDGPTVSFTTSELELFAHGIDACRRGLRNPAHFNCRLHWSADDAVQPTAESVVADGAL